MHATTAFTVATAKHFCTIREHTCVCIACIQSVKHAILLHLDSLKSPDVKAARNRRDSASVGRGLPRSLLDIERARGYQSSASANPNPDLQCQGCPTTDTRARVTDTTEDPFTAIGLLAREEQMALSACVCTTTSSRTRLAQECHNV